jgi:hypothetical protein
MSDVITRDPIVTPALASLTFDGTAQNATTSGTSISVTLNTTNHNNLIFAVIEENSPAPITGVTSTSGLSFSQYGTSGVAYQEFEVWKATAPSPLTNESITVTMASAAYLILSVFAVSNTTLAAPFDPHPFATSTTGDLSITTTNANNLIIACYRLSQPNPTAGTSWTTLIGANYTLIQYLTVTSPQTNLDAVIGVGAGTQQSGISIALVQPVPFVPGPHSMFLVM